MIEMIEIGKCCEVINGSTPSRVKDEYWGGEIDWFTPKDLSKLTDKYVDEAPEKITQLGYNSCSTTMIPANSLMFTSRAPIGHLAINKRPVCTNQGFKNLVPKENIYIVYLYYVIKKYTPNLQDLGNGATFKELSKASISAFKIPLPPLDQQKKIAAILDEADKVRQLNKQLIKKYDALTQSLFWDMFGDPVTNPMGWVKKPMENLMTIVRGGSPRPINDYLGGRNPWIKIGDATKGDDIYLHSTKEHIIDEGLSKTRLLPEGSLIFANCGVSLGFARIIKFNGCIHDGWLAFSDFDENIIDKVFLLKSLNSVTQYFRDTAPDGTQPNLNTSIMKKYEIILPPIELQKDFVEYLNSIYAQKAQVQQNLEKAEELFNSLLQKAFKVELV